MTEPKQSWITYRKPQPDGRVRLFCFPYAGAGASLYRLWQDEMPPTVEICPIQLPGREGRVAEKPFDRIDLLVRTLLDVLHPEMNMPFAFFGHSMGALISFVLARHLRKNNMALPVHLFLSGYQAPPRPGKLPPISHLPKNEFIDGLRRFNQTPEEVLQTPELLELLLPTLRADFSIYENYVYQEEPPLAGPITAFGGTDDEWVDREDLEAWEEHTQHACEVHLIPGGHFFVNTQYPVLANTIQKRLRM